MKTSMKRWIPLAVLLALMTLSYCLGLSQWLSLDTLKTYQLELKSAYQAHPALFTLAYILVYILVVTLSIPGAALLTLCGGFLIPQPFALLATVVGATLGASFLFLIARSSFSPFSKRKLGPFLTKMKQGFQEDAAHYLLFLRLVPLFPFWAVNLAPALLQVRLSTFIWTTFLGIIPGSFLYTQAGAGLGSLIDTPTDVFNPQIRWALFALGLVALFPIIYRKKNTP